MTKIVPQKKPATNVVQTLQRKGHTAFFAGGCVRDELLGRVPKDYDVATSALPEEVEALFPKTIPIGKAFGVIAVVDGAAVIEVATFREDFGTIDGRRPESVLFSAAKEDALRRDFTINGMFYDPVAEQLHDYVHGQRDLKRRIITAIGNPVERFKEDHLRMMRAVRFAHNLGFALDPATESAIRDMAHLITRISAERIELELSRTLTDSPKPGDALKHLYEIGLLQYILPEIVPMVGQEQPPQFHPEGDVFEHTVLMLNLMNKQAGMPAPQSETEHVGQASLPAHPETKSAYSPRELAFTVLLHDVGKPPTACMGLGADGEPRIRFDGHAQVGAAIAEDILIRLKFPNKEKKHIVDAIRDHMRFMDVQQMRTSKLRKMIGAETFDLDMELHRLDCLGSHAMLDNYDYVHSYMEEMANEPILPEPWVRGHDLIALGIKEGKLIGKILREAYDAQMESRFADREEMLEWIKAEHPPPSS
ncbi:CCA tRNA nucleotidyltransferase [Pontiella sulfatireligans]|uniref:CCA-adding enzyme n=1 Tax=Pontiella sulfatireligans TaxID=2750658 RepID=A0A6C2UR93_9BACT|nr:CCA tRNA nucleotidyltransferase [Pontiella sulfatireligans]VGO22840.1 CCA-adding enzyme [Pontiella sulfatireligans]